MCRPPPSPPGAPFIGPFAGGLVVSDWEYLQDWIGLTLPSERSRRRRTARRFPAAASFRQRRRQVRLAYPQGTHVGRIFPSAQSMAGNTHPRRAWQVEGPTSRLLSQKCPLA